MRLRVKPEVRNEALVRANAGLVPITRRLNCSSARHEVEDDADKSKHQQNVNPGTDGVYADYSEEPQYKQDNCDRPKHFLSP